VGLLGGSFNPAHEGHLHISLYALNKLKLDEVWWLVSPHNPLKNKNSLADYDERLKSAQQMGKHPRITVSDFEQEHNLTYTYETIRALMKKHPHIQFVWLMGADNLAQFHRWQRWQWLARNIPIVVFDRAPYSHSSKSSKTYLYLQRFLMKDNEILTGKQAPALKFVHMKLDTHSSTAIRKTLGKAL